MSPSKRDKICGTTESAQSGYLMSPMPSSPIRANEAQSRKQKRPPPITPKRFNRFFTPASLRTPKSSRRTRGRAGNQLRDITRNAINRRSGQDSKTKAVGEIFDFVLGNLPLDYHDPTVNDIRKRSLPDTPPCSSPTFTTPTKRSRYNCADVPAFNICEDDEAGFSLDSSPPSKVQAEVPTRIARARISSKAGRILARSFGDAHLRRDYSRKRCVLDWHFQTQNFMSNPDEIFRLQEGAIPFCLASCNYKRCGCCWRRGWLRASS